MSLFILAAKVTADLTFITNSVNLSKIKPVATESSQTYYPIAVGRKKSYQTVGNLQEFSTDLSKFPICFLLNHLSTFLISIFTGQSKIWNLCSFHGCSFQNIFFLQKTFHRHDQVEHVPIPLHCTSAKETVYKFMQK